MSVARYVRDLSDLMTTLSLSSPNWVDLNQTAPSLSYIYPFLANIPIALATLPRLARAACEYQLSNLTLNPLRSSLIWAMIHRYPKFINCFAFSVFISLFLYLALKALAISVIYAPLYPSSGKSDFTPHSSRYLALIDLPRMAIWTPSSLI